jgi:hypothetical protein
LAYLRPDFITLQVATSCGFRLTRTSYPSSSSLDKLSI